ncbi:MAG: hypothetical protein K2Q45_00460 [Nitrosomonas sp.]|nr:hypothetical protein [Nitrosomonas sp.]
MVGWLQKVQVRNKLKKNFNMRGAVKIYNPDEKKKIRILKNQTNQKLKNNVEVKLERKEKKEIRDKTYRIEKLVNAMKNGAVDKRKEKRCGVCKRLHIDDVQATSTTFDEQKYTITGIVYVVKKKEIFWKTQCIRCTAQTKAKKYVAGGNAFVEQIVKSMTYHLAGTYLETKAKFNTLLKESNNKCAICNIELILKGKSGWKQLSITDKYPNLRSSTKTCELSDLAVVCLACQKFQNDMPWHVLKHAILEISETCTGLNQNAIKHENCNFDMTVSYKRCREPFQSKLIAYYGMHCAYTGILMTRKSHSWKTISFDRHDSQKFYSFQNVQLVCKNINYVKSKNINDTHVKEWLFHLHTVHQQNMFNLKDNITDAEQKSFVKHQQQQCALAFINGFLKKCEIEKKLFYYLQLGNVDLRTDNMYCKICKKQIVDILNHDNMNSSNTTFGEMYVKVKEIKWHTKCVLCKQKMYELQKLK